MVPRQWFQEKRNVTDRLITRYAGLNEVIFVAAVWCEWEAGVSTPNRSMETKGKQFNAEEVFLKGVLKSGKSEAKRS